MWRIKISSVFTKNAACTELRRSLRPTLIKNIFRPFKKILSFCRRIRRLHPWQCIAFQCLGEWQREFFIFVAFFTLRGIRIHSLERIPKPSSHMAMCNWIIAVDFGSAPFLFASLHPRSTITISTFCVSLSSFQEIESFIHSFHVGAESINYVISQIIYGQNEIRRFHWIRTGVVS